MSVVMVVEDEPILRDSMVRSLRRLPGVEVVEAARFAEARRLVVEERPALLVSDLSLPDASALGLLAELDAVDLRIPVIFVTAYFGRFRDQVPRRDGVEVYEKPLPMSTLREMVLQQLEAARHRLRAPFTLAEYLQMAGLGRHSALIRVGRDGVSLGWLRLVRGELWSARCGEVRGEQAVWGLTCLHEVRIDVELLAGDAGPREIHAPVEAVLLDAFRLMDEAKRDQRASLSEVLAALEVANEEAFSLATSPAGPVPAEGGAQSSGIRRFEVREVEEAMSERVSGARGRLRVAEPVESPPVSVQPTFEQLLEAGREAVFLRDYTRARQAFEAAAARNPDHPGVRANLERLAALRRKA